MQPTFLGGGHHPSQRDTKWFRWQRILGEYQDRVGALVKNNPRRNDTIWQIKYRLIKSITNT